MRKGSHYLDDSSIININGKLKTSEDKQRECIEALRGEKEPIPEARPAQVKKFNEFLDVYQEDIHKIIGKHRGTNHLLTHEELVSEVNLSFLKKRDELIFQFGTDFTQTNFRKLAFAFVKNITRWSYGKIAKSSYVKRRNDNSYYTEEGPKTSFEYAVDRIGEEESFYEDFDRNEKCEYLLKMIKDYTGILSDAEVKALSMLEKGMTHYEMAEAAGVTRQAISIMCIHIFEKIRAHFTIETIHDQSYDNVSKGYAAIEDFFSPFKGYVPIKQEDKPLLKRFLLANAKCYTFREVSVKFLNGLYTYRQIISFAAKNKLTFCLLKKDPPSLSESQSKKILSLAKEGKTTQDIASIMKIPIARVSGKRGFFARQGLIPKVGP